MTISKRLTELESTQQHLPIFCAILNGDDITLTGDGKKLTFRNEAALDRWASENLTDTGKIRLVKYRIMRHDHTYT